KIRGAGNLLGEEQSGHILSIGFEMYSELLNDEVRRIRGEKVEEKINPEIKADVPAGIPEEYIADQKMRLYYYKKISGAEDGTRIAEIRTELSDMYGRTPAALENMLEIVKIKQFACLASIERVEKAGADLFLTCRDPELIGRYLKETERAWSIESGNVIRTAAGKAGAEWLAGAGAILQEIAGYVNSSDVIEVEDARLR
ncbi:MAG: hypothetical protein FJ088_03040, partial [Deltaproteobacteria bacterium]|nr:hypothetical protein [Deltaproteobacteria bacterium]